MANGSGKTPTPNESRRGALTIPNRFQVYLHDKPAKRLFSYDRRAFSQGYMRVRDPTKFAELMLLLAMNGGTPNSRQLYSMFGQPERDFKLVRQRMVHLTYHTAFVDDSGKLKLRGDIQGIDARIHTILHSDERRIADVAPPPGPKRDLATLRSNQEILRRVERREAPNPFSLFERLHRQLFDPDPSSWARRRKPAWGPGTVPAEAIFWPFSTARKDLPGAPLRGR